MTSIADDIIEFHAARVLLLLNICGTSGKIDGLTKFAKLDFFSRYPVFFEIAKEEVASIKNAIQVHNSSKEDNVESMMVRHHYGPWDKRYYHILAHLEARQLIIVTKNKNAYRISLTSLGQQKAKILATKSSFELLIKRMREIKDIFGSYNGSKLKDLIYKIFEAEVSRRSLGELIKL